MPSQLQREPEVLAAVRELLEAGAIGDRVTEAMATVVRETSSLSLANLDEWERRIKTELWHAEQRPPAPGWRFWNRTERFASWLDLCSGDGFRRERIMRSVSEGAPNAFFFALALRRLNDWVPQVRAAARERLRDLTERSRPEHVVDAFWHTFAHWSSWGRMEEPDRHLLVGLASVRGIALALKARIQEASAGPASHVLAQAGRGPALDSWLEELARAAVQPSVRAMAYRCLLEERIVWTIGQRWVWTQVQWCKGRYEPVFAERALPRREHILELFSAALVDRSPRVRRIVADFAIKRVDMFGAEAHAIALRLASDSNPTVAERGRYALKLLDGTRGNQV